MTAKIKSVPAEAVIPPHIKDVAILRKKIEAMETALALAAAKRKKIDLEMPCRSNTIEIGIVGDTQYGSTYECKDEVEAMYDLFASRKITRVFHTGDVLDGIGVYKGQQFYLHADGWERQRDWFAKVAPRRKDIDTYFITGNHDESFKKLAGIDVGPGLEDARPDWKFIGADYATIDFHTPNGRRFRVGLMHPGGGSAYSLSYKPQKIVEGLEGGTKPHLLAIGHFHKAEFLPAYRNVAVVQSGCFQRQTPFMVTKGLAAHVGGWVLTITVHPKASMANTIAAEFTAFYRERS